MGYYRRAGVPKTAYQRLVNHYGKVVADRMIEELGFRKAIEQLPPRGARLRLGTEARIQDLWDLDDLSQDLEEELVSLHKVYQATNDPEEAARILVDVYRITGAKPREIAGLGALGVEWGWPKIKIGRFSLSFKPPKRIRKAVKRVASKVKGLVTTEPAKVVKEEVAREIEAMKAPYRAEVEKREAEEMAVAAVTARKKKMYMMAAAGFLGLGFLLMAVKRRK